MSKEIVLATDLGGTNLRMAAIDCCGKILFRTKSETPRGENPQEIVRAIVRAAAECRENRAGFQIRSISAAVPGTIKRGLILKAPNLPALDGFAMADALENELGIEAVLENDANAAAIGENWLGASKGFADSICVTLGTGIGGGIIIGGKILRGAGGAAGEIGHICVVPDGASCGCGARGCVEQYASASAIIRLARELKPQYLKSILNENPQPTAYEVYQAGTKGDELALEVFRQMGFYLGIALSDLLNVLDPEVIVIGGGAAASWNLFMPSLQETVRRQINQNPARQIRILPAELDDNAGIIGAARLAFDLRD